MFNELCLVIPNESDEKKCNISMDATFQLISTE